MANTNALDLLQALTRIPCGVFVMCAAYEEHRSGIIVKWVQQCCSTPPMVMVALRKGQPIEPLIRDSRSFTLCQITDEDRLVQRRFIEASATRDDPFITFSTRTAPGGAPIVDRAQCFIECELIRHIELDSDHHIYVGQVLRGSLLAGATRHAVNGSSNGSHGPTNGVNGSAAPPATSVNGIGGENSC